MAIAPTKVNWVPADFSVPMTTDDAFSTLRQALNHQSHPQSAATHRIAHNTLQGNDQRNHCTEVKACDDQS
jgi:hypothetical protein